MGECSLRKVSAGHRCEEDAPGSTLLRKKAIWEVHALPPLEFAAFPERQSCRQQ